MQEVFRRWPLPCQALRGLVFSRVAAAPIAVRRGTPEVVRARSATNSPQYGKELALWAPHRRHDSACRMHVFVESQTKYYAVLDVMMPQGKRTPHSGCTCMRAQYIREALARAVCVCISRTAMCWAWQMKSLSVLLISTVFSAEGESAILRARTRFVLLMLVKVCAR